MSNNDWAMTTLLWQLYDQQGRPIDGGGAAKLQAIMTGMLHGSAHVWIWRRTPKGVEVLMQKRAATKINWPGLLDKSAGGHITYGEQPIEAAVRKCALELGVDVPPERLQLAGVCHWQAPVDEANMTENEYQWVYIVELADPEIHVPTAEVEAVMWKPLVDLLPGAGHGLVEQCVPYGLPYFLMLHQAITQTAR